MCATFARQRIPDPETCEQYMLEAMKAMIEFLFGESYYENLRIGMEEQDVVGVLPEITYIILI